MIGYNERVNDHLGFLIGSELIIYNDAIVVENYLEDSGEMYTYYDWSSLKIIYQEFNGVWYIVGMINNEWTVGAF